MAKAPTQVLKQGRVTIPAKTREELNLEHGDYVIIDVQPMEGSQSE